MNLKSIYSELKRRNVPKAALAYFVVSWMIIQVASILLPAFNTPDWVFRLLVIILIICFPFWIIFSWVYDISSKGLEKTLSIDSPATKEPDTAIGDRLNKIIIICLSIAVVILLYNQFSKDLFKVVSDESKSSKLNGALAVLPLTNNKPDQESDYLGFAISNQIIGDLMYLRNLNIRSSHEVRKYDGQQQLDISTLKDELNVDFVMLGNYLKEQNHIRVNVELIDLETKEMIWRSDNIEVDFSNTFTLQDIVAKEVVNDLNISFSEREMELISKDIPQNPLAYEYYLKSSSYPLTTEGDQLAIEMLRQSIQIDSTYAPAYADLGFRTQRLNLFEMLGEETLTKIEHYYLKALRLNPNNLKTLGYLAIFYAETDRTEKAINITREMLDINPNNTSALFSLGYIYRYIGMIDQSVNLMEKAVALDPNNPNYARIGVSYICQLQNEKALEAFRKGGETPYFIIWQGITLYRMGRINEALTYFDQIINSAKEPYLYYGAVGMKAIINDQKEIANQYFSKLEEGPNPDSEGLYFLAAEYVFADNKEDALRCLKKAIDEGYYNYPFMLKDPMLDPIRKEKEFQLLLEQAKEKHDYFKMKYSRENISLNTVLLLNKCGSKKQINC